MEQGWSGAWQRLGWVASNLQDHAGKDPVQNTDGVLGLVVGRDGNVHIWQWGVSVTEGNCRDVDVSRLLDRLVVSPGVSQQKKAGLLKHLLDLVSEGSCSRIMQ